MPDLDVLLLALGAGTSLRWAVSHRVRPLPDFDWGDDAPPDHGPDLSLTALWNERVACKGGALPDTALAHVLPIKNGREGLIELVPGRQTTRDAMAAGDRICSALQLAAGSVVVEPTRDGRADHARLLVVDDNPQQRAQPWPGPSLSLETGCAHAGVFADEVPAAVRWFTPGSGATNILVAGAPGSGKTRFLDWVGVESMCATYRHPDTGEDVRWVETWLGDGQQGQSLPDWLDVVDWPATTTDEIVRMFRAVKRRMDRRSRFLARFEWVDDKGRKRRGLKAWDPVLTGLPLLQVVLDECHAPLGESAELVALAKEIARKGRKCGIRLVFATQVPSVQNLGNDIDLRSLLSGNVICFRTQDRISGGMAFAGSSADMDPSTLPKEFPNGEPTAGLGYVLGPGARPAPMRNYLVDDPYDVVVDLPLASLAPFERKAAGEDYEGRWDRIRADLEDDDQDDPVDEVVEPSPLPLPEPEPVEAEPVGVPAVRDMVLAAIEGGARRTAEVNTSVQKMAAAHGVTRSLKAVGDALRDLSKAGEIVRLGQGRYTLPGHDEGEVAA